MMKMISNNVDIIPTTGGAARHDRRVGSSSSTRSSYDQNDEEYVRREFQSNGDNDDGYDVGILGRQRRTPQQDRLQGLQHQEQRQQRLIPLEIAHSDYDEEDVFVDDEILLHEQEENLLLQELDDNQEHLHQHPNDVGGASTKKNVNMLQLYRVENIAIPLCYFMVGIQQGLIYPLLNVYPIDLGAKEAQQTSLMSLVDLPSCFKILFGFVSDAFPINGYRRKPYMMLGYCISSTSLFFGLLLPSLVPISSMSTIISLQGPSSLNGTNQTDYATTTSWKSIPSDDNNAVPLEPAAPPSMGRLFVVFFIWAFGIWFADVMGDSLVAERAKYESPNTRGNSQIICYISRGVGFVLMSPLSSIIYSTNMLEYGPFYIIVVASVFPVMLVPFIYTLQETKYSTSSTKHHQTHYHQLPHQQQVQQHGSEDDNDDTRSSSLHSSASTMPPPPPSEQQQPNVAELLTVRQQCNELWTTVCSRAVWQPVGFIYIYIVLFVKNAAWREFLKTCLKFTPNQLNTLLIIAAILAFVGVVVYKVFLHNRISWRNVFLGGIALNGMFSAFQLLLISGHVPFGMNPFYFALGDDAMIDFIIGTQYIPTVIMLVSLVPTGIEGASYALFTTTWNTASALSDAISTMLLRIWDVSKPTLANGELSGLTNLTILTTAMQLAPLLFVWMVPHSLEDLSQMRSTTITRTDSSKEMDISKTNDGNSSKLGGAVFLIIVSLSILYAIFVGIMNVSHPGWMGES